MQAAAKTIKLCAKDIRSRFLFNNITHMRNFGVIQNIDKKRETLGYPYFAVNHYKKNVGDFVKAGEAVAEIEFDMHMEDLYSEHTGVITKFFFEKGDIVEDGVPFFEIDTDAKAPT